MPTVRFVTQEEIQAAADQQLFTVTFMRARMPDKVSFTVKSQVRVTTTRKGERVEEVVEFKPNDCEDFRWLIVGLYGGREGFVYTTGSAMYDGNGDEIKAKEAERAPKVLSKDHLKALQEGRKRARQAKAAEKADTPAKPSKQFSVVSNPDLMTEEQKGEMFFRHGYYRKPCSKCGEGIKRTGKKGRAPSIHEECK